jgi:hypothetical protein
VAAPNRRPGRQRRVREGLIFEWFTAGQLVAYLPQKPDTTVQLDDFRYGIITDPGRGLWGMKGHVDTDTLKVSQINRTRRRTMEIGPVITSFWLAVRGHAQPPRSEVVRSTPSR